MASIKNAMCQIASGDFTCGFEELAAAYSEGQRDPAAFENLKMGFWAPNAMEMEENYAKNKEFLEEYPFLLSKRLVPPKENRYLLFPLTEKLFYCFDQQAQAFMSMEIDADRETGYFFQNLTKPLLVEDEYNLFNLRFLRDNVRRSEDFAADNHIYLHYTDEEAFSLLLYYSDVRELCKDEKFVFLISEERELYPLDFKVRFGIDYDAMEPQKLRIEEMQRICFWYKRGYSGSDVGLGVLELNPYVLMKFGAHLFQKSTIQGHALISTNLPEDFIKKTTQIYTLQDFENVYFHSGIQWDQQDFPDVPEFIQWLKNSNIEQFTFPELFRAYFIYSYHKLRPQMNPRIVPLILWEPHLNQTELHDPLILDFPYRTLLNCQRNPIQTVGRILQREGSIFFAQTLFIGLQMHPKFRHCYYACRFEDLKLHPKETCQALCQTLNVPYDDIMLTMDAPCPGAPGEPTVHGFDLAPLHRNVDSVLSQFDQVRLQIFFDPLLRHFNYPAFNFDDCPMNDDDVAFLLKFPFKCEKAYVEEGKWGKITKEQLRQDLFQRMLYAWKLGKNGGLVFPKVIWPKLKGDMPC